MIKYMVMASPLNHIGKSDSLLLIEESNVTEFWVLEKSYITVLRPFIAFHPLPWFLQL